MERHRLWIGAVAIFGIASFLVALLAHAYIGTFARYFADDYRTASILQNKGLIGAQLHWYRAWSGRFSFTLAVTMVELAGIHVVPTLPYIPSDKSSGSEFWVNRCVANYYGLDSIVGE